MEAAQRSAWRPPAFLRHHLPPYENAAGAIACPSIVPS